MGQSLCGREFVGECSPSFFFDLRTDRQRMDDQASAMVCDPADGTSRCSPKGLRPESGNGELEAMMRRPHKVLRLQLQRLKSAQVRVQEDVDGVAASHLGLGSSAPANLALRRRLGHPGAPFGGMGFLDPQKNVSEAAGPNAPPRFLTQDVAQRAKLREFERCAQGQPSIYFWALQPIYDSQDRCAACEVLVRCRNGADSAPYEDVQALMNPAAPPEVRRVYALWKATEVIDWILSVVKAHPTLCNLSGVASNLRPLDLSPSADVFREVKKKLFALSPEDQKLLLGLLIIEVTEDQEPSEDMSALLSTWEELGFRLACDDMIGELACEALGKRGTNFHTTEALKPYLHHFRWMKVDIEWAGFALFLSHPSYSSRSEVKQAILKKAQEEDMVYVPEGGGSGLRSTGSTHSALLEEFATWAKEMIALGKQIYVELSVSPNDDNNRYALGKLKALGLDLFGEHQVCFRFQGGPTGARAFEPAALVEGAEVLDG